MPIGTLYSPTEWDAMNAYDQFGVKPAGLVAAIPGVERSAGPGIMTSIPRPWHTENPLFWFAAILAVTVGLVAGATELRVGPFRAGVHAGKT